MKTKRILSILLLCSLFVIAPVFFAACSKRADTAPTRANGVYHMIRTVNVNWTSFGGNNKLEQNENDIPYSIYVRIADNRVETFWFNKTPMTASLYNLYRYTTTAVTSSKLFPQFNVVQDEGKDPVYIENTNLGGFYAFVGGQEQGPSTTCWHKVPGSLNYPQSSMLNNFGTYVRADVVEPHLSSLYFGGSVWWNNKTYLYTSNNEGIWIFTNQSSGTDRIAVQFTASGLKLYPNANDLGPASALLFDRD